MAPIVALALKDLRLLLRMRAGLFFTFVWPLLIAVGFGVILSGPSSGQSTISVAVVDEDHTPGAAAFLARLEGASELETARTTRAEAEELVRKGTRTAFYRRAQWLRRRVGAAVP
jgi:ABC-2 type transport system permease protein